MDNNAAREDLAFIRAAIEEGRSYATGRSPDMVVWGIAIATAFLANLPWLRWVAVLWWAGELAVYALRRQPEALLLSAVLMLALLAGPGLFMLQRRRSEAA